MRWTEKRSGETGLVSHSPRLLLRSCLPLLLTVLCSANLHAASGGISAVAQNAPAAPASAPAAPSIAGLPQPPTSSVQPRFTVVLDASHGEADHGAHLGGQLEEKDLVLLLAIRLESMLKENGVAVVSTRAGDAAVTPVGRAELANSNKAAACISLHATVSGSGVHLFTASMEQQAAPAPFVRWDAAQAPYIQQSLKLSAEINSAMTHAQVPVTLGRTSLQPLNNLTCPAVAVEIAPLSRRGSAETPLTDPAYQSRIVDALAAAVMAWKRDWVVQP